jgi:hypothetical protein
MSKKIVNKPSTPKRSLKEGAKVVLPKTVQKVQKTTDGTGPKIKK